MSQLDTVFANGQQPPPTHLPQVTARAQTPTEADTKTPTKTGMAEKKTEQRPEPRPS